MNKTYIKPSSVRIAIFTESDVAEGISYLPGSGDGQDVRRRHQPSDEWTDDFEDEDFIE